MGIGASRLLFPSPEASYKRSPYLLWLTTSQDEVIPAFFIDVGAKYTLLFSHGNAEDLGHAIERARLLSPILGVNIFAYEYTGYGLSTGAASEEATYADIEAAFQYLTAVLGVPWSSIILYGWSLGSGPSVHLASRLPVRGVVLHSAFASVYRCASSLLAALPGDAYPNVERIGAVRCPIYIVHGVDDFITPVWHAHELAASCRAESAYPPLLVEDAGHHDVEVVAGPIFVDGFLKFLGWLDARPAAVLGTEEVEERKH